MGKDRHWMYLPRRLDEFENGIINFLNASFAKAARGSQIRCPCRRCKNRYWYCRSEVFDHLKVDGFVDNYYVWTFHGEEPLHMNYNDVVNNEEDLNMHDNVDELLHDRFRDTLVGTGNLEGPNEEAQKFYKILEEGKQELFPGCKNFFVLSFIIRLFLLKTLHGLSNVAFDDLLKLLRELLPEAKIPIDFNRAKSIMRDLGLDYKKIYACQNDCMLYWKEFENAEECHVCHTSKWKQQDEKEERGSNKASKKKSAFSIET